LPWLCSRIWSTCPGGISRTVNVCVAAVIPDIVSITTERDFRHRADLRELSPQALGDWWIETKESAVLEVASTVVPHEHNYLLNPAHPEFAQIATEPPALFHFDPRLFR
jgi:RES domain-containing protein